MAVIASREDLKGWLDLDDVPRDWAVAIAARAALRVLPLIGSVLPAGRSGSARRDQLLSTIILPMFRGMAAPWAAAKYPARGAGGRIAAARAASAARAARAASAASAIFAADAAAAAVFAAAASAARAARAAGGDGGAAIAAAAADAAADAAIAATRADAAARGVAVAFATAAATALWTSISADVAYLERTHSAEKLLDRPLWLSGEATSGLSIMLKSKWSLLARRLRAADPNWKVWTDWYADRLAGRRPRSEEIEVFRVTLNDEGDWRQGDGHVNRLIADKIAEKPPEPVVTPPPPRAASIQPEIVDGKVAVPSRPAQTNFDPEVLAGLLVAMRTLVSDVAQEAARYPQVDPRAIAHLDALAGRLADMRPLHLDFFAAGFEHDVLKGYAATVKKEWPDTLIPKYEAVVDNLGRVLARFPAWVDFKKNLGEAPPPDISPEDIEEVVALTRKAISELRAPESSSIVDASTPDAIEHVLEQIHAIELEVGPEGTQGTEEAAERIADLLEGLANTAKRFIQLCRDRVSAAGGPIVRNTYEAGKKFLGGATGRVKDRADDFLKNSDRHGAEFADRVMHVVGRTFGPFLATAIVQKILPGQDPLAFLAVLLALAKGEPPPAESGGKTKAGRSKSSRKKAAPPPETESDDGDEPPEHGESDHETE